MAIIEGIFSRAQRRREARVVRKQARNTYGNPRSKFHGEAIEPRLLLSGELAVSQFQATATGFNVQFNQNVDASVINLYDVEAGTLGAADVTVVGASTGNVKGSLVVNNNQISFIRDGGLLAPDTYTVTLRSAANGFKDLSGGLLDGDNNGVAGGNYINAFTINPSTALTVSIPDFARGPAQKVNVAETDNGLAIKLSDGTNVTSVSLTLKYDPSLLKITQVNLGSTLPNGSTVQSDLIVPGILTLNITSLTAIGGSNVDLVRILSEIPAPPPTAKPGCWISPISASTTTRSPPVTTTASKRSPTLAKPPAIRLTARLTASGSCAS